MFKQDKTHYQNQHSFNEFFEKRMVFFSEIPNKAATIAQKKDAEKTKEKSKQSLKAVKKSVESSEAAKLNTIKERLSNPTYAGKLLDFTQNRDPYRGRSDLAKWNTDCCIALNIPTQTGQEARAYIRALQIYIGGKLKAVQTKKSEIFASKTGFDHPDGLCGPYTCNTIMIYLKGVHEGRIDKATDKTENGVKKALGNKLGDKKWNEFIKPVGLDSKFSKNKRVANQLKKALSYLGDYSGGWLVDKVSKKVEKSDDKKGSTKDSQRAPIPTTQQANSDERTKNKPLSNEQRENIKLLELLTFQPNKGLVESIQNSYKKQIENLKYLKSENYNPTTRFWINNFTDRPESWPAKAFNEYKAYFISQNGYVDKNKFNKILESVKDYKKLSQSLFVSLKAIYKKKIEELFRKYSIPKSVNIANIDNPIRSFIISMDAPTYREQKEEVHPKSLRDTKAIDDLYRTAFKSTPTKTFENYNELNSSVKDHRILMSIFKTKDENLILHRVNQIILLRNLYFVYNKKTNLINSFNETFNDKLQLLDYNYKSYYKYFKSKKEKAYVPDIINYKETNGKQK